MLTDSDLHSLIGVLDNDNDDNDDDGGGGGGGERYRFDPSDLWPLPLSFGALTVLWTALLVLWIGHIVYYRRKYSFGLHRLLCVLPVAKMLSLVLGLVYYRDCVAHGVVGDGMSCRIRWTYFLYDLSDMVFLVAIFHVLFLLSKGYSITRNHFEEQERKAMLWNLSCIAICRIAYSMSNYFVVRTIFVILYIFVIFIIIIFMDVMMVCNACVQTLFFFWYTTVPHGGDVCRAVRPRLFRHCSQREDALGAPDLLPGLFRTAASREYGRAATKTD